MMQAMGARLNAYGFLLGALLLGLAAPAQAGPKPTGKGKVSEDFALVKPVDVTKYKSQPIVLINDEKSVMVIYFSKEHDEKAWFFGTQQAMYAQRTSSMSRDKDGWSLSAVAPRLTNPDNASSIEKVDATTYKQRCANEIKSTYRPMPEADAAKFMAKAKFFSSPIVRTPTVLARDNFGTYYYVDQRYLDVGGEGYRVFVGKKGAMKQLPLIDVANDTAGRVFATKSGTMRLVTESKEDAVTWIEKKQTSELKSLNTYIETHLIYRDLGIYKFLGTPCDDY